MALLIIADKTVGPITDFHNLIASLADDKIIYVISQRANRARFIAHHFIEAGYDVHNLCNADNTIDSQVDRILPALQDVERIIVAGSLCASTAVAVAGVIDAFLDVDRPVLSYEV